MRLLCAMQHFRRDISGVRCRLVKIIMLIKGTFRWFNKKFRTVLDCVETSGFAAVFLPLRDIEDIVNTFIQKLCG